MTEAEWLTCKAPEQMSVHVRVLGEQVSRRKLQLFAWVLSASLGWLEFRTETSSSREDARLTGPKRWPRRER
jgi:hypothetical protein